MPIRLGRGSRVHDLTTLDVTGAKIPREEQEQEASFVEDLDTRYLKQE